jgi:hypothetical protein
MCDKAYMRPDIRRFQPVIVAAMLMLAVYLVPADTR